MSDQSGGREVCTIAVARRAASYVRLAFELCATGEYSLERLAQTLTDRGYKHEAQTSSGWTDLDGTAGRVPPDRYCLGIITYNDEDCPRPP